MKEVVRKLREMEAHVSFPKNTGGPTMITIKDGTVFSGIRSLEELTNEAYEWHTKSFTKK